ncbi:MAG TPA: hypothetical protein VN764_04645, partial [Polyangiaceae bacterium]|nr:hypothetical protein [Polyangiaceae bacterium]
ARGALGVAQLALKIMDGGTDAASPIQKIDNALTRLGWLVERLPLQYALCVSLPAVSPPSPSVFSTVGAYVQYLRRTQPRRIIDFNEGTWGTASPSEQLVPYAAGFSEFAFRLSPARAKLALSVLGPRAILIESECPERPAPFDACLTMSAADVEAHGSAVPYRLLEIARLAQQTGASLNLELTSEGFSARVVLPPSEAKV